MFKKAFIFFLLMALGCLQLWAQEDYRKAFEQFTARAKQEHAAFSDTVNAKFARALSVAWQKYSLFDGEIRQVKPEPEALPIALEAQTVFKEIPVSEVVDTIPARCLQETDNALWKSNYTAGQNSLRAVKFEFYNAEQVVSVPKEYGFFHPKGISEAHVSAFWEELSRYDYSSILSDCAKYREVHGYNDWAVMEWLQGLATEVFPRNVHSERTIFAVFLLNQMGLMTKLARTGNQLISLFSSKQPVYARKFVVVDTYPFYLTEKDFRSTEVYTYNAVFAKTTQPLDMRILVAPTLGLSKSRKSFYKHSELFGFSFELPIDQALVRFYESYPQTSITVYASAIPEACFSQALTTAVREKVRDMSDEDAVNQLLAFVQTDFSYQTDIAQFGYEKPFFCEENFVYGSNDCEDRAALFAYLVRSILGKKVVLLEYPDHISTAVMMQDKLKGDHICIGGEEYYVCDPSFIGATMGMAMPKYRNTAVKVYMLTAGNN